MNKTFWIIGVIVVVLLLITFFVGNLSDPAEPLTQGKQIVKIGVLAPLTGVRADGGEFTRNAIKIAEEEIAENKNLKYQLEFFLEDTKYEPPVAVSALRKLIDFDNVKYVIGPYGSSEVMAAAPVAETAKTIMIITGAQSEEISQLGDYIFRIIHNSAQEAPVFAKFVAKKMKSDTLHFLAINSAISDPYLKSFRPSFEAEGKKIGLIEKFDQKASDYKTELVKIKNENPTDIFLLASPKMAGLILKQANELGIKAQFYNIGVESPEIFPIAGQLAEGLFYPYSYDNQSGEQRVKAFYESYLKNYDKVPDTIAANTYDAIYLLSGCFEKNGDNVESVKQCLYETTDFRGASGTFSIDKNGDAVKDIFIKTIKDGQFVRFFE